MHVNFKRATGVAIVPLLAGALAVGVAALPANAATWNDVSLSGSAVTAFAFSGTGLGVADGTKVITLVGTGVTWSLHGTPTAGVTLSGTTISYSGAAVTNPPNVVAIATDSSGDAEALEIPVTLTAGSIQANGAATSIIGDKLSALADANTAGTVKFSATSSTGSSISFAESNLPAGLVSGNPTLTYLEGTAAPGTYSKVVVTATDANGAVQKGTFALTVSASDVYSAGTSGDEVNPFGNGFDVYKQHDYAGAIIAGWTATKADPATNFLILAGPRSGEVRFEYNPSGKASGLCVSDPAGGWASDPLRDGLILTVCNTGPYQEFVPQLDGALKNLATGLVVNPNGTGAQLRGGTAPSSWGGSVYGWTPTADLPA